MALSKEKEATSHDAWQTQLAAQALVRDAPRNLSNRLYHSLPNVTLLLKNSAAGLNQ